MLRARPFPLLVLLLLIAARAGAADTTPPAAVVLAATAGIEQATLSWTSPGDDGNTGTADHYDIRTSTNAIDASNWASAFTILGPPPMLTAPTPQPAGTPQSLVVTPLNVGAVYHFAMVTYDLAGNMSAVSNDVAVIALPPAPVITLPVSPLLNLAADTGSAFSYGIYAVGTVDSYAATGLPPGLAVDTTTGEISGTPTTTGLYTVNVSATNVSGTATGSFTITVTDPPPAPLGGGDTSSKSCGLGSGLSLLAALSWWATSFRRAQRSRLPR